MRGIAFVIVVFLASCSRAPATNAPRRNYGAVMSDIGHRYELAGRAAAASRFELAAFEVDEMRELFEGDLAHAELPKEGPSAQLASMADAFLKTNAADLSKAAQAKDARAFTEAVDVSGVVLTKTDGSAKGGVVLAVREDLGIPIRFVGVGERPDDLRPFDPEAFAERLLA